MDGKREARAACALFLVDWIRGGGNGEGDFSLE
jgi:hypothetical protein